MERCGYMSKLGESDEIDENSGKVRVIVKNGKIDEKNDKKGKI